MPSELSNLSAYNSAIATGSLAVVDFFADWCGPCRAIAPLYEQLSQTHTDVHFYKVNVDNADDICNELGIESMPTFVFAKNGQIVAKLEGADANKLRQLVEKHK